MTDAQQNIVDNLRRDYTRMTGDACPLSDAQILRIWTASSGAPTAQDRDEWTLDDLYHATHGKYPTR